MQATGCYQNCFHQYLYEFELIKDCYAQCNELENYNYKRMTEILVCTMALGFFTLAGVYRNKSKYYEQRNVRVIHASIQSFSYCSATLGTFCFTATAISFFFFNS